MSLFAATIPVTCPACAGPLRALTPSTCIAHAESSVVLACDRDATQWQLWVRLLPVCPDPSAKERKRRSVARLKVRA